MYKSILFALLALIASSFLIKNEECPHNVEVLCIDDINKAYPVCAKAAQSKGKDYNADLECLLYSNHVSKDCWPCVCLVAHTAGWKVKGC